MAPQLEIEFASEERRLRFVGRLEIDARSPIGVLDLHAVRAACRSMEADFAFPVA